MVLWKDSPRHMLQVSVNLLVLLYLLHTHLHQSKPAFQPEKDELETMMFHRTLEGGSIAHYHKSDYLIYSRLLDDWLQSQLQQQHRGLVQPISLAFLCMISKAVVKMRRIHLRINTMDVSTVLSLSPFCQWLNNMHTELKHEIWLLLSVRLMTWIYWIQASYQC